MTLIEGQGQYCQHVVHYRNRVTVPSLTMMTSTVSEKSLARDMRTRMHAEFLFLSLAEKESDIRQVLHKINGEKTFKQTSMLTSTNLPYRQTCVCWQICSFHIYIIRIICPMHMESYFYNYGRILINILCCTELSTSNSVLFLGWLRFEFLVLVQVIICFIPVQIICLNQFRFGCFIGGCTRTGFAVCLSLDCDLMR